MILSKTDLDTLRNRIRGANAPLVDDLLDTIAAMQPAQDAVDWLVEMRKKEPSSFSYWMLDAMHTGFRLSHKEHTTAANTLLVKAVWTGATLAEALAAAKGAK